jgi:ABC-type transporter Mla subunit MlaD
MVRPKNHLKIHEQLASAFSLFTGTNIIFWQLTQVALYGIESVEGQKYMATQEERLTAVEKFTEQAAAHIRDTEENTTILLGVIRSQGQDIKRIFERLGMMAERQEMNERFDTLTSQLDSFASQLSDHTAMLAQILTKLDELK